MTAKRAISLLRRSPELLRAYLACVRYRIDKNALRLTVQTLKDIPAEPASGRGKLVFFAHFDPYDEVDEYVRFYLEKLYEVGSTIIFVSGSPRLKTEAAAKIAPFCAGIYTRRTLSLDFGSWNLAWQQMQRKGWRLDNFDHLLLANDSVYGPLFDLGEMFAQFTGADMYGVTESHEECPHLQSYFLYWDLNTKTREFITKFWRDFRYVVRKTDLIQRYELGISVRARESDLRQKAYITDAAAQAAAMQYKDHEHADEVAAGKINNSLYLWDTLIAHLRCPFLKTDLPRQNRYNSVKMLTLSSFLGKWTEYDPRLIDNNLKRLKLPKSDLQGS